MDDQLRVAIASEDAALEIKVAGIAKKLGLIIDFRTYSKVALLKYISCNSTSILLVEESLFKSFSIQDVQLLQSVKKIIPIGIEISETQLLTLIHENSSEVKREAIKKVVADGKEVIAFASIGRTTGTSTIAFEYALELTNKGVDTLFIDAHASNPFLLRNFQLHGVNKSEQCLEGGLRVIEFNPDIDESATATAKASIGADVIVVDLGEVTSIAAHLRGNRKSDRAIAAFNHSIKELVIVERADATSIERRERLKQEISQYTFANRVTFAINFASIGDAKNPPENSSAVILADYKTFEVAKRRRSSIMATSARSPFVRELKRFIESSSIGYP